MKTKTRHCACCVSELWSNAELYHLELETAKLQKPIINVTCGEDPPRAEK